MGSISDEEMVVIGLDPHPGSHTAAALSAVGLELDEIRVAGSRDGLRCLETWAEQFPKRCWAIEGPGNRCIRSFADELVAAGELVYAVTPSMTARYRKRGSRGKDDEIDATNAARSVLANTDVPVYRPTPYETELKELTRAYQRVRCQLTATRMSAKQMVVDDVRAALEEVIRSLEAARDSLKRRMAAVAKETAPHLLDRPGVGPVIAATVVAEAGRISRFPGQDHFASYAGAAPVRWASGAQETMRVNTGGNRRINWAAHMVAKTRLRIDPQTKRYRDKKLAEGKTQREVFRLLKTYICREFYRALKRVPEATEGR